MATEWSEDIAIAELSDEPALSDELAVLIDRVKDADGPVPHVVLNAKQDLTPPVGASDYGPLTVPPVPMPGKTKLERAWND